MTKIGNAMKAKIVFNKTGREKVVQVQYNQLTLKKFDKTQSTYKIRNLERVQKLLLQFSDLYGIYQYGEVNISTN